MAGRERGPRRQVQAVPLSSIAHWFWSAEESGQWVESLHAAKKKHLSGTDSCHICPQGGHQTEATVGSSIRAKRGGKRKGLLSKWSCGCNFESGLEAHVCGGRKA
jgi:hypothetical protein